VLNRLNSVVVNVKVKFHVTISNVLYFLDRIVRCTCWQYVVLLEGNGPEIIVLLPLNNHVIV